MLKYCRIDRAMEARDHSKNAANPKSLMSRKNVLKSIFYDL